MAVRKRTTLLVVPVTATQLNLVEFARRFGRDHGSRAKDILPCVYCSKCRAAGKEGKQVGIRSHPAIYRYCMVPGDHPMNAKPCLPACR